MNQVHTAKRVWSKPEITVAQLKDAQTGNNSQLIDQAFPAANGTAPHFS